MILKTLWNKWLAIARPIGNFQAQLILSLAYLIIFLPLGLFFRFFKNPFSLKNPKSSFSKWEYSQAQTEEFRKQY